MVDSASADALPGLHIQAYTFDSQYEAPTPTQMTPCNMGQTVVSQINADWGGDGPGGDCPTDFFAIHYWGFITSIDGGNIELTSYSDDGFRVSIGGQSVIEDWNLHGCGGPSGTFNFEPGVSYPIDAWMYEYGGGACAILNWTTPNSGFGVVPNSAFTQDSIPVVVVKTLNAPKNVTVNSVTQNEIQLSWDAPDASNAAVERYAIFFSYDNFQSGWAIASTTLNATITGVLNDKQIQIKVRSDNDSLPVYSEFSNSIEVNTFISPVPVPDVSPSPAPSVTPEPSASASPSVTPEPSSSPSATVTPSPEPSPLPTTSPEPLPSPTPTSPLPIETSLPTPIPSPIATVVEPQPVLPQPSNSPTPIAPIPTPIPEPLPTLEPTPVPIPAQPPVLEPTPQPQPTPQPEPSTPVPTPLPLPTPPVEPSPQPTPLPIPEPIPEPLPIPSPEPSPVPVEPIPSPAPAPEVLPPNNPEPIQEPTPELSPQPLPSNPPSPAVDPIPDSVQTEPPVVAPEPEPIPAEPSPIPEEPAPIPVETQPSPEPIPAEPAPVPQEPEPAPELPVAIPDPESAIGQPSVPVEPPALEPIYDGPESQGPPVLPEPEPPIAPEVPEEPVTPPVELPPIDSPVQPSIPPVPIIDAPNIEPLPQEPQQPPVDQSNSNLPLEPPLPPEVAPEPTPELPTTEVTAETWVPPVAPEKYLTKEEIKTYEAIGLVPNNPEQLPIDIPKPAPAEVLVPHIQQDVTGVENGGIQFFGTQDAPQVVGEDGNLTPPAPAPGSGDPIPADAITTEDTFIGQPGGTTFNAPDIAVPVEPIEINIDIPGVGQAAQAMADAYVAMANIGNDMSPITRKKAKKILIATLVVGQITQLRRRF